MLAYLARRLLLVVPTLFGIMLANFIIVQARPGGPVDLMLARLRGHAAGDRPRGRDRSRETAGGRAARPGGGDDELTRGTRGIDPELVRQLEEAVRLRPAGVAAVRAHDAQLCGLRSRHQLLSRPPGARPHAGEAAGLDHARPVDDAARLPDLDPAGRGQGRARRHALRRVDERAR